MNLDELKTKLEQMPSLNKRGMYSEIDKDKVEQAVAEIFNAGPEAWTLLLDQIVDPSVSDDHQARYALHAMGLHISKLRDADARKKLTAVLARPLGGNKTKPVQAFLAQELWYFGTPDALPVLANLLGDAELCDPAAMAMMAHEGQAAPLLRQVLPQAKGKCRRMIIQCLGQLRDEQSAGEIAKSAGDQDVEMRMVAVWALANIGQPSAADAVLKAAQTPEGWERTHGAKCCLLLAERLVAAGKKSDAARLTTYLKESRTDKSEKYVAEAAGRIM